MNIVIDIRCLLESDYSGVPGYTYNLLKNLFKIDSKNHYFLFYNKYQKHSEVIKNIKQISELLNYSNVKVADFHFPNKLFNFSLRFFKYPKLDKLVEKKIGGKIDVWFFPNLGFLNFSKNGLSRFSSNPSSTPCQGENLNPPSPPLRKGGNLENPPSPPCQGGTSSFKFILTIHDLSFERYPEFFASKGNIGINYIRGRFWHKYVNARKICEQANKIITVSESTKNDLMDIYKISEEKIKVIYEGANTSRKSKVESQKSDEEKFFDIKDKYNLPEKFILFLGTLEPRKNIAGIIRAFEILAGGGVEHPIGCSTPYLVIAGKKGWLYDDLFKMSEKSRVKDKIKFIGYVDEDDKSSLYELASLFVFPSFYEGFGLPPLEAMACGVPVIASTVFSLSEVVGDAGILVDPYNVNEIAGAMKAVLNDDVLRARLIEKGLKRSEMFSWEKAARESLGVFDENFK
jgi:glycosyltransferase involved in cell wall biosynthesis